MAFASLNGVTHHYHFRAGDGVPIVCLNSLGTDFRIWDEVIAHLDGRAPVLCMDKRGHGLSDDGPITMDDLVDDVAALMDHLDLSGALICGVSMGGLIAQGLIAARPDLVSGLVLCCTGAKIGDAAGWNARIEATLTDGIASMSEAILERWFSESFRENRTTDLAGYRNMLTRTSADGYAGVCGAIRDSDFTQNKGAITVPTACIAGSDDLATPPELVKTLAGLIPNAGYKEIERCGHLPCIEASEVVAASIADMRGQLA